MPAIPLSCPNCDHVLNVQISVDSAAPRQSAEPRKYLPLWDHAGRINLHAKYGAASQIAATTPGDYKFSTLYAAYNAMVDQGAVPAISFRDYAKLLTLLGCIRYRAADHRGYTVRPIRVDAVHSGEEIIRVDVELIEDGFPEGLDDETEPADDEDEDIPIVLGFDGSGVVGPPADLSMYMAAIAQDVRDLAAITNTDPELLWKDAEPVTVAAAREAFEKLAAESGVEIPPTLRGMLDAQSDQASDMPKEAP